MRVAAGPNRFYAAAWEAVAIIDGVEPVRESGGEANVAAAQLPGFGETEEE